MEKLFEALAAVDPAIAFAVGTVGGLLVKTFGGKLIPAFKAFAKTTPTKVDDAVADVAQALADEAATKDKTK